MNAIVTKVDFRAERKDLYAPGAKEFSVVDVPPFEFLAVDGKGDPNSSESYADAVGVLFSLSYAAKFASKLQLGRDYAVAPLEGLWWVPDESAFASAPRDEWLWTVMVRQPAWLTGEIRDAARAKSAKKSQPALELVRTETFAEGLSVQIMHIGSYADEAPTIARLHAEYLPAHGFVENGHHHEIYLGDPRRTAPEKLKTIIRQPVRPTASAHPKR